MHSFLAPSLVLFRILRSTLSVEDGLDLNEFISPVTCWYRCLPSLYPAVGFFPAAYETSANIKPALSMAGSCLFDTCL